MAIDKSKFLGPFKAETKEHLGNLNQGILDLEKDPGNTELLENLMREAHTVKGSATMMGFTDIADIAHKMEDGFENAPDRGSDMGRTDYDLLFESLDTIESLLEGSLVRQAKSLDESYIQALCGRLQQTFVEGQAAADVPDGGTALESAPEQTSTPTVPDDAEPVPESTSLDTPSDPAKIPGCETSPSSDTSTGQETPTPVSLKEREVSAECVPDSLPDENTNTEPSSGEMKKEARSTKTTKESIRVEVEKLNHLMNLSGEMLTAKIQLSELIRRLTEKVEQDRSLEESFGELIRDLNNIDESIRLVVSDIQDEALNLRMLPVSYLFGTFPRAMRDLAKQHGKEVELVTQGEETHLDKNIIDRMREPLMHLLRNSVDHGIEDPAQRLACGKPAHGTIILNAYQGGAQVVLEISDDGGGIDLKRVEEHAIQKGLMSVRYADQLSDEQKYQLLFTSGFSTKDIVTETSGRGVGLDVVRSEIQQLKGNIEVLSEPGQGTQFIVRLPLTLSITETLLIACGDDAFAVPIDTIVETTRISLDDIETVEAKEVMSLRGEIIPLIRIHQMFSLPKKGIIEKRYFPVVIVQSADKRLGLLVDEIVGHQDTVIKPLGDPLKDTPNIAGGTVLGDGRVVLILDIPSIICSASNGGRRPMVQTHKTVEASAASERRILLAEDTPSTAMLERSVLEAAGFEVHHAKDGQEALEIAAREEFDMVISDVLMPRMNGFELTASLKADPRMRETPVVIVTTRGSDADKKRGLDAGADAYILKKDFTSDSFLETIDRLLS